MNCSAQGWRILEAGPQTIHGTKLNMNDTTLEVLADKPQELTRRASDIAGLCRDIVLKTAVNIQGRKYIKVEGWMAIATAHGCVASCRDVEKVAGGFRAIGEIRRIADGQCLATAEGFVGEDEPTWFGGGPKNLPKRADYAIRAMCQTRAISRVCRSCFAHVVVLMDAGLSTTPAEEVPDNGFNDPEPLRHIQHVKTPPAASQTPRKSPPTRSADPESEKPSLRPQDIVTEATEDQRARMVKLLEPMRQAATQMFIELSWLLPTETLEDTPLSKVPTTKGAMDRLMAEVQAFVDGVPPRQTKADDEWWREIIVPVPHAGQKRDEYLTNPDTIGGLYDVCESDEEARRRLFGFVGHYQPKSWTKKDGTEMPPSNADIKFREALDAFNDWHEKRRVTEAD